MRYLTLMAFMVLPGCSVFEPILGGLGNFIDENDDGPIFAYVTTQVPPRMQVATITPSDRGLVLSGDDLAEEQAEAFRVSLSPTNSYVAVRYDLFIGSDADFGFNIFSTSPADLEHIETDNTLALEREFACLAPELNAAAEARVRSYLTVAFPDRYLPSMDVNVTVSIYDSSDNNVSFLGWTGETSFRARGEWHYDATYSVPEFDIESQLLPRGSRFWPMPIETQLTYERQSDGEWVANACPDVLPMVLPRRTPVRDLSLESGQFFLDGELLRPVLPEDSEQPFILRSVTVFDGPY